MHTITWTAVSIYFWPYSVDAIFKTAGFPHRIKFLLLQKIVHIFFFTSHPIPQCHATFHSPSPHFFIHFPLLSPVLHPVFSQRQFTASQFFKEQPPVCSNHPPTFLSVSYSFSSGLLHQNLLHFPLITPLLQDDDDDAIWVYFTFHLFFISSCLFLLFLFFCCIFYLCFSCNCLLSVSFCVHVTVALLAPHPLKPLHCSVVDQVFSLFRKTTRIVTHQTGIFSVNQHKHTGVVLELQVVSKLVYIFRTSSK